MNTRTQFVLKNIQYGMLAQFISYILSFITRTLFIRYLTAEYLGVNNLFSNIILLFSITESGIGAVYESLLYGPLQNHDDDLVFILIRSLKKAYRIIAVIIGMIGLALYPFLPYFVGEMQIEHIGIIYIMFLVRTMISYSFTCYQSLIFADQKRYIYICYEQLWIVVQYLLQICVLLRYNNFLLYICIQMFCFVIPYIQMSCRAKKMYPYIKTNHNLKMPGFILKEIKTRIKVGFLTHFSYIVKNGTDTLVITKIFGLYYAGICSNYLMIIQMINTFSNILYNSFNASVGNLIAEGNRNKIYDNFKRCMFLSIFITGFSSICLMVLFNPFITLWAGDKFVLDWQSVSLIILTNVFTDNGFRRPVLIFKNASGLFVNDRWLNVAEGCVNFCFSIVFAKIFGLGGIFFATIVSSFITTISGLYILFKHLFECNIYDFIKDAAWYVLKILAVYIIVNIICLHSGSFTYGNTLEFIGLLSACASLTLFLFFVLFYHNKEFKYFCVKIRNIFL